MARHISTILAMSAFLLFISISVPLLAQTPDDPSIDDPAVPVDGGLSLLLAAGAVYGVRRVRRRSKREDGTKP